jgi:threonine/homoserine/homoserine lactone efflux protein
MPFDLYLAYVAACLVLALIPGPVVTLLIANGLSHGLRASVLTIAGAQAGLLVVIAAVAVGLTSLMFTMGAWFDWVRFLGAAYLIWLGIAMVRSPPPAVEAATPVPRGEFFLQGFLVLMSNPKVLVFFGAFIPQFVDMNRPHAPQVVLLGITFMVIAAATDMIYALAAGRARHWLSVKRSRWLAIGSGSFLIGGGLWLALLRAR